MKVSILTLFPEMVAQGLNTSILGRAIENGYLEIQAVDIRKFTTDKHGKVDDYTYGGGAGMLMQAQPVFDAWKAVSGDRKVRTVYVTPQGLPFKQSMAADFAKEEELVILCGHYEGIDERVLEETVTDYVSIGDYVLTGGELAAMVIVDAVSRLVPGVLGNETSAETESFHCDLLEYPQYSRPESWHEKEVPKVLLSGDHKKISEWRLEQSLQRTRERRPDLYQKYQKSQAVIKRLSRQKRNMIHIIETLSRGLGEILYENGMDVLVYNANCKLALMNVSNIELGSKLLELIPGDVVSVEIGQDFMIPVLKEKFGMHVDMSCYNVLYTSKEQLPVRHKDIRPLTMTDFEYVHRNYHCGNAEYVQDRIQSEAMFGVYLEDKLCGFIGEHEEGSIGLLYIDPQYRGLGLAKSLEGFMINRHRHLGFLPFGQVEPDNDVSLALQNKCGLYLSEGLVWWMSIGDKWQM